MRLARDQSEWKPREEDVEKSMGIYHFNFLHLYVRVITWTWVVTWHYVHVSYLEEKRKTTRGPTFSPLSRVSRCPSLTGHPISYPIIWCDAFLVTILSFGPSSTHQSLNHGHCLCVFYIVHYLKLYSTGLGHVPS